MAYAIPNNPNRDPFTFDPISYVIDVLDGVVVDEWQRGRWSSARTDRCMVCGEDERTCEINQSGYLMGESIPHEFERGMDR